LANGERGASSGATNWHIPDPQPDAYTDDPGFFVSSDDEDANFPREDHFFPTLQWFGSRFGISKDDLTILDTSAFNRWMSEENRFPERGQKGEPSA